MEDENHKNYLDERRELDGNNSPDINSENEIKSEPKKELLGSSSGAGALKNNSNEVLDAMKKKKRKDMTIPIILGVVFLIIITAVAGFYLLRDTVKDVPIIGGGAGPQQRILNSSLMAMNDVESYLFEGDFNFDFTKDDEEGFSLAMKFDGQVDGSDTNNIKSSFNVSPEISVSTEGGSEDVSFDFSMRSFGKVGEEMAYFKLNDFDLGAAGLMYGEMIVPYKNKWYFLDMKELQEKSNNSFEGGDFDIKKMIEEVKDLSRKYEMIKFQKDLGDTKLDDAEVYHYQVGIDSKAVLDFYIEFLKTSPFLTSGATDSELENFETELEENREEILIVVNEILTNVEIEVWIGKDDKIIHKIAMSGRFDEEFMNKLENKLKGTTEEQIKAKEIDAEIKEDIRRKQRELILYYDENDSYEGFIGTWGGTIPNEYQKEIHVKTDGNSYVVWSELWSTVDKWCVDSTGKMGYVLEEIKETQCPSINNIPQRKAEDDIEIKLGPKNYQGDELSFDMLITMSDFNQPVNISKPEETEDLIKVLEEAMAEMMGGMMMPKPTTGLESDFDQDELTSEEEEFYGTDPNNPDTDGDGFSDGNEVSRGYDPLLPGEAKLDYDKMLKY